jgi:aminoglycoside phosphotransferase (APT) family kinase protein
VDTQPPLVDPAALERHLRAELPGDGALEVERHRAGHSNETFFVTRGEDRWVLRRPPRPPYLPTAHDVSREYTVLRALGGRARVPRTVHFCDDDSVIGAPFYLMERVDGHVVRDAVPPQLDTPADRARFGDELVDALAELHAVDHVEAGLDAFGKPSGYVERQLARWTKQYEGARKRSKRVRDLELVARWLRARLPPEQPHTIVQGDYKLDNVMFAREAPARLVAILDWEMATIGDPLADVGWMLSFWHDPGDEPDPTHPWIAKLFGGDGWRTRADLVARYEQRSGRAMTNIDFYTVLAIWKLAVLLLGSYARYLEGTTDDPFFASLKEGVPALARRAQAIIDAAG